MLRNEIFASLPMISLLVVMIKSDFTISTALNGKPAPYALYYDISFSKLRAISNQKKFSFRWVEREKVSTSRHPRRDCIVDSRADRPEAGSDAENEV